MNKGFSLVEVMIVILIIGILSAVLVPSTINLVESGRQNNRMNIARTIYLAAQNQLSKIYTEKNLRDAITHFYYRDEPLSLEEMADLDEDDLAMRFLNDFQRVDQALLLANAEAGDGADYQLSLPSDENHAFIRYVDKPAGPRSSLIEGSLEMAFYDLLDEIIIDKEILNNAILMEFNIITGVILSLFYGDADQVQFVYENAPVTRPANINLVAGDRGEGNGYQYARERRQGFFGVQSTGKADVGILENLPFIVNIYDGMLNRDGLVDPVRVHKSGIKVTDVFPNQRTNILYAEFLIPSLDPANRDTDYHLSLKGAIEEYRLYLADFFDIDGPLAANFREAVHVKGIPVYLDTENIVTEDEVRQFNLDIDLSGYYDRYIWVIDYIGDDTANHRHLDGTFSIGAKIKNPQYVRAELSNESGVKITSRTREHSHFAGTMSGGWFEIRSARHLNNIRYAETARAFSDYQEVLAGTGITHQNQYRQTLDINLRRNDYDEITDFIPLGLVNPDIYDLLTENLLPYGEVSFTGVYNAMRTSSLQYRIDRLIISDDTVPEISIDPEIKLLSGNVGLFGTVDGGRIQGLSLYNVLIKAETAANAGALAGRISGGGRISQSFAYGRVSGGSGNTGGLVGHIADGSLEESFNAGFSNPLILAEEYEANCENGHRFAYSGRTIASCCDDCNFITSGGVGWVVAGAGNIGGLAGKNDGIIIDSFNNARVNITALEVVDDLSQLMQITENNVDDGFYPLTGEAYLGGISGDNAGQILNSYATNYLPLYSGLPLAEAGGISGRNTGLEDNSYYLSNGLFAGSGGVTKEELQGLRELGSNFRRGDTYVQGENAYQGFYPYPVLRRNNPFGTAGLNWHWEDIHVIPLSSMALLYYEIYADGTFGYSPGGQFALERDGRNKIVVNDGYLLEFDFISFMEVRIGAMTYRLIYNNATDEFRWHGLRFDIDDGIWVWDTAVPGLPAHTPVWYMQYYDDENDRMVDRFRLFFENSFLEGLANGANSIGFHIRSSAGDLIYPADESLSPVYFNPLYADTVDLASGTTFLVRSPRHLRNISEAPAANYVQERHLDFGLYRKELLITPGGRTSINIAPSAAASASSTMTVFYPERAINGMLRNGNWQGWVSEQGMPQWLLVEFPEEVTISRWVLYNDGYGRPDYIAASVNNTRAVMLQSSSNGTSWTNVDSITANTDNIVDRTLVTPASARYFRLLINEGQQASALAAQRARIAQLELYADFNNLLSPDPGGIRLEDSAVLSFETSSVIAPLLPAAVLGTSPFTGFYDGGFYEIRKVNARYGLFEAIGAQAVIDRLNIVDSNFTGFARTLPAGTLPAGFSGDSAVGAIAAINYGTIKRSSVQFSTVSGLEANVHIGGIVGVNGIADIENDTDVGVIEDVFFLSTAGSNAEGIAFNIAPNAQTTASSTLLPDSGNYLPSRANDGVLGYGRGEGWVSETGMPQWLSLDFPEEVTVSRWIIYNDGAGRPELSAVSAANNTATVALQASNNGTDWTTVDSISGNSDMIINRHLATPASGRYFRLHITQGQQGGTPATQRARIAQFELYTEPYSTQSETHEPAVSDNGGGIAGLNLGSIRRILYLAPAPSHLEDDEIFGTVRMIYPFVRSGLGVDDDCFYLRGHRYSRTEARTWENVRYNFPSRLGEMPITRVSGGGVGMVTNFVDLEWFNFLFDENLLLENIDKALPDEDQEPLSQLNMGNWAQPSRGYPYPVIAGMTQPERWAEADSPIRPDQVDRDDWYDFLSVANRPLGPEFVNGDFIDAFLASIPPAGTAVDNVLIPPYQYLTNGWFTADMSIYNGWYTRPVDRSLFNPSNADYFFPTGDFADGYSSSNVPRWRLIEVQEPNSATDFMPTNYLGQNRARNAINDSNNVRNSVFRYAELNAETPGTLYQVLPSTPGAGFFYSYYHATNSFPGYSPWSGFVTPFLGGDRLHLYLSYVDDTEPIIVETEPYAFVRDEAMVMIRPSQSPRSGPAGIADTGATNSVNTANLGLSAGNAVRFNLAAWNTVAYGASSQPYPTGNNSGGPYDLSYHRGREYLQPDGSRRVQNIPAGTIYLYDVWIDTERTSIANSTITATGLATGNITANPNINNGRGGTRTGYGITFWSTRNLTANNAVSSATNIHMNGITLAQLNAAAPLQWVPDARNNVIGYWDVSYGWKRYYGEYTVPDGQTQTEFAFQSRSGPTRVNVGNYLDGVSFKSPAFLTIDKYIRDNAGNDVSFVKPGDHLVAELFVKNHGEVTADNIVITDRLWPFDEYIAYDGMIGIERNTSTGGWAAINNCTVSYSGRVLTVSLPQNERLELGDEVRVRFRIRVRDTLMQTDLQDHPERASTLLYFFRNQGVVNYRENLGVSPAAPHQAEQQRNGSSPPVQVFIDPVKLSKTVTSPSPSHLVDDGQPVDGPFTITLRIEDTTQGTSRVRTTGLVTDLIPDGFRLAPGTGLSRRNGGSGDFTAVADSGYQYSVSDDGSTRMTISGVNLGTDDIRVIEYRYELVYNGLGYGVAELQIISDYKYLYRDEYTEGYDISVMLVFPKAVAGISVKTENFTAEFDRLASATQVFNITENDGFFERLAEDNYDVMATVVFTDPDGNPFTPEIPATPGNPLIPSYPPGFEIVDGNQRWETDDFIANIVRGTWNLEFTPKTDLNNDIPGMTHILHYRIMLTATKPGSPDFNLHSPVTQINIVVPD
ncbi:MAG: discoidin domain-containing protein [Lachnospiraceae bacterium]|nr:discoidin domain-containing protein [Lachnospiraceae bacterium]